MKIEKNIVVLASTKNWEEMFTRALELYQDQQWFYQADYAYKLTILPKKKAFDFSDYDFSSIKADVYIARGTVAEALRHMVDTPIAQVSYSNGCFKEAVRTASEKFHTRKIAAIGYNMSVFASDEDFSDDELKIYDLIFGVNNDKSGMNAIKENIEKYVELAINDGYEALVCGSYGYEYAIKKNYPAVYFDIDFQQACDAIEKAIYTINYYTGNKYRQELLRDIMHHSFEAIICLDKNMEVNLYSPSSTDLLLGTKQYAESTIPSKIQTELKKMGIIDLVRNRNLFKNYVFEYKTQTFLLNIIPNMGLDSDGGAVVMLEKCSENNLTQFEKKKTIKASNLVSKNTFMDINGNSPALQKTINTAKIYAQSDMSIMLIGKTGTGKELFARSIHNASRRKNGPFVAINCAALPENLLESELFGYVEGAFTGAAKGGKRGLFEIANGGTLFMDEVAEIPLSLQSKFLRAIQEKEIIRLGDDKSTQVDVRVISATNRSMEKLVMDGKFREDLYYRLDVLRIELPTLAERREDIQQIAESFFTQYCEENNIKLIITKGAYNIMKNEPWPGNIRQMQNVCMRAAILAEDGVVSADVIERALSISKPIVVDADRDTEKPEEPVKKQSLDFGISDDEIIHMLKSCGGNRSKAAEKLGLSRSTLYRRLKAIE